MRFYSRTLPLGDRFYHEAMLRSSANEVLLHIRVPDDDVSAWLAGLLMMRQDQRITSPL